jgi:hypothetical protein
MNGFLWCVLSLAVMFLSAALGDLISAEIRGWLNRVPDAVLKLATFRLDPADRETTYREVWGPDLDYYLRGDESRPITRLIRGMAFAVSLAWRVRSGDAPPPDPISGTADIAGNAFISATALTISVAFGDVGVGGDVIAKAGGATATGTAGGPVVVKHVRRAPQGS